MHRQRMKVKKRTGAYGHRSGGTGSKLGGDVQRARELYLK